MSNTSALPVTSALLSAVVETGDRLQDAGTDYRSAFIGSALANHAARHAAKGKVTSAAIVKVNTARPVVAGVPSYRSATSVDCHALAGAALSHGYDDETDPFTLQADIIDAVAVVGMKDARKILTASHETAEDALSALLQAVADHVPATDETDETDETDDETGDDETDDETAPVTRITAGLALILDALNDGETFDAVETASFLALCDQVLAAPAATVAA